MSPLAGLQLLSAAVVLLDRVGRTLFINHAAEQLFQVTLRMVEGTLFAKHFIHAAIIEALVTEAGRGDFNQTRQDITLHRPGRELLALHCVATVPEEAHGSLLLEFREIDQRVRMDREVRLLESARINRELVRNLAHEIKNPLGGIRGAAQLLEAEMEDALLGEYTQVIIKEADRLQTLVDRLLEPHRHPRRITALNIHEVLERVRAVVIAEYPLKLAIERDYDASLPQLAGDGEQLIQVFLNLVRNAAQAMEGRGVIRLMTRIARQVTIDAVRYKLALDLHVIDNGPGVPESMRDRIFFPLVSGRAGGSGLGLSIAQTFVQQHGGVIGCESHPGKTDFRILLPLS